eukprot:6175094-Pleurochrysis_carterae.AAC.1
MHEFLNARYSLLLQLTCACYCAGGSGDCKRVAPPLEPLARQQGRAAAATLSSALDRPCPTPRPPSAHAPSISFHTGCSLTWIDPSA